MRLIALVSVASAVSTLALPYTPSGQELEHRLKKVGRQDDPQSSTSKFNEFLHVFIALTPSIY